MHILIRFIIMCYILTIPSLILREGIEGVLILLYSISLAYLTYFQKYS